MRERAQLAEQMLLFSHSKSDLLLATRRIKEAIMVAVAYDSTNGLFILHCIIHSCRGEKEGKIGDSYQIEQFSVCYYLCF